MISVSVKVKGDKLILGGLRSLRAADRGKLALEIARAQVARIKARVAAGQLLSGQRIIPSKRAERDGGQTLMDRGHMLGGLRARRVGREGARVDFRSLIEALKAFWTHYGTRERFVSPRDRRGVLAWKPGGGRAKRGEWHFSKGHTVPGLVPRPWFGIGINDVDAAERQVASFCKLASKGLVR